MNDAHFKTKCLFVVTLITFTRFKSSGYVIVRFWSLYPIVTHFLTESTDVLCMGMTDDRSLICKSVTFSPIVRGILIVTLSAKLGKWVVVSYRKEGNIEFVIKRRRRSE